MLSCPSSRAAVLVSPRSPHLLATYAPAPNVPPIPDENVVDHDAGARGDEAAGGAGAHPSGTAGDDHCSIFETSHELSFLSEPVTRDRGPTGPVTKWSLPSKSERRSGDGNFVASPRKGNTRKNLWIG